MCRSQTGWAKGDVWVGERGDDGFSAGSWCSEREKEDGCPGAQTSQQSRWYFALNVLLKSVCSPQGFCCHSHVSFMVLTGSFGLFLRKTFQIGLLLNWASGVLALTAGITWTAVRTAPCTCRPHQTRAGEGEQRVWVCTVFSDPATPALWFFFCFPSLWNRDAFFSKTGITKVCISSFQLKNCIIYLNKVYKIIF